MTLDYLINRRDRVWELTLQHLSLSATAILIALLFAIPLGVLAARNPRISTPMLGILGAIYTIPSLAFLALLIPSLGIGRRPAIVVLAAYAQIFLVRNIATGLRGVDPATLEAALGLGMTRWQQFAQGALAAGAAGDHRRVAHGIGDDDQPGHGRRLDRRRRAGHAPLRGDHPRRPQPHPGRRHRHHRAGAADRRRSSFRRVDDRDCAGTAGGRGKGWLRGGAQGEPGSPLKLDVGRLAHP